MTPGELLTLFADYRAEYLHCPEPQHSGDIEAMSHLDLIIWAEVQGIRLAAKVLSDPTQNYLSLPSWRWDAWLQHIGDGRSRGDK